MTMRRQRIMKEVEINGVKVKIELLEEEKNSFPKKLESKIRIKDEEVEPISVRTIFF